ncbi:hypothetical protein [Jeotgalibacillus aurantiacus]|uniref:hypothetical protein n=1 Tax=Jeotgalibacillus aurantiacus TaxID=2763266 RepID=UPI001D0B261B|nr:hypothetical protein [Jeotgalibacillus aurantiacus]
MKKSVRIVLSISLVLNVFFAYKWYEQSQSVKNIYYDVLNKTIRVSSFLTNENPDLEENKDILFRYFSEATHSVEIAIGMDQNGENVPVSYDEAYEMKSFNEVLEIKYLPFFERIKHSDEPPSQEDIEIYNELISKLEKADFPNSLITDDLWDDYMKAVREFVDLEGR